ncbi:putative adhesin-like protein [Candida albicans SC5314]|uniref:Uncharacterized protein n=2 Tax=Candida albicans TaxID=5476 RepID=C4YRP4_CANAW|nr:conserved hypothetical protein [Candida albicans WO-1]KGR07775.1 hypothetical protein MG3_04330 [Candida albicans P78048]KGU25379.1 putative adhesin-like protein [Candida albicans P75063]KHC34713.1 putative adhesin-like protein [Candida albicans Ca6]KHC51204.1 putative adhesin-like protein [Candida albicans P37039]KHC85692.1 putative adhesin-like protein [Candida albicans SC5314]
MSSSSLPSQLVLDGSASTTATVTPSLTDLQAVTQVNGDKSSQATIASDSVQTISASVTSQLVYASVSSQLTNAIGSFTASSDVKTLTLSSASSASSSKSSGSSNASASVNANSGNSIDLKKVKYGIILSSITVLSFICSF